jgi:hypothetical protein
VPLLGDRDEIPELPRLQLTFPDGEDGDKARAMLPDALKTSHERLCAVSRTVELGTPIGFTLG